MRPTSATILLLLAAAVLVSSAGRSGAAAAAAAPAADAPPQQPPPPPPPQQQPSAALPSSSSPPPPPPHLGRSAAHRRALLQSPSASATAAVARSVNCSALPGLQACAEPLCFDAFELRRNASTGAVDCRPLPPAPLAAINLIWSTYDGDYGWLSTGDNALAAASVVDNTNAGRRFATREGSLRLRAPFAERTRNVGSVLGGWLGRFSQVRGSVEGASSWSVGNNGQRPLQTETSIGAGLPRVAATAKRGLYGPGFTSVERGAAASASPTAQGGSVEDNVALDVLAPFGVGGRRRLMRQDGRTAAAAPSAAAEREDLAALRAQLRRLVAKGAVKGDAIFGFKPLGGEGGGDVAAAAGGPDEPSVPGARPRLRTSGGGGGGGGGGRPPSADLAPALLPFCRPRLGLLCSDTDLLRVLRKARPDAVLLSDDAPAWAEGFATLELDPRLLVRTDPIAGALPAASLVANAKLDGRLGTLPLSGVLRSTLASTGFGLAPAAYSAAGAAPALAATLGQGRTEATLELREVRPRLVVFPGANFGSLAGLTTIEATQG